MLKRRFGNTDEEVTVLGLGGFHLLEISDRDAVALLNAYLDAGGNYIETAAEYGQGESERKVGLVMKDRREDCLPRCPYNIDIITKLECSHFKLTRE